MLHCPRNVFRYGYFIRNSNSSGRIKISGRCSGNFKVPKPIASPPVDQGAVNTLGEQ